jgi:hypothetical protein
LVPFANGVSQFLKFARIGSEGQYELILAAFELIVIAVGDDFIMEDHWFNIFVGFFDVAPCIFINKMDSK